MGERLEATKLQEAGGPLDGVDGAEDGAEQLPGGRVLLEGHQVAVELVEGLVALDQELRDELLQPLQPILLGGLPLRQLRRSPAGRARSSEAATTTRLRPVCFASYIAASADRTSVPASWIKLAAHPTLIVTWTASPSARRQGVSATTSRSRSASSAAP